MILHADMDAFYAAIEQRDRPELRGRPVIVGADPRGRGVVSTASYEAREYGVHSAMPIGEAYRRCPGGVYLPVRMAHYVSVSRDVMQVFRRYSPLVEPLSIDEAFMDMTGCERLFGSPEEMARSIQADVQQATGLSCSVGVAPNKFLAKLATELAKPAGIRVIHADQIAETLGPLPVGALFGIGKKTACRLEDIGVHTVGELRAVAPALIEKVLGKEVARHALRLSRGEDERRVESSRLPKQHGSERTFAVDMEDIDELKRQLHELAIEVGASLRHRGYRGRRVRLKLRTEDFATCTRTRSLATPTDSDRVIYRTALELLEEEPPGKPVRLIGVTVVDLLHDVDEGQGLLFGPTPEELRRAAAERAVDRIKERFGEAALRPASLLPDRRRER